MRLRPLLCCTAAVVVPLGLAGSALASPAAVPGFGHQARPSVHASSAHSASPTPYQQFAGYYTPQMASSEQVTTTFVVPRLKCGKATQEVGIGEETFSATGASAVLVAARCAKGKAHYVPVLFIDTTGKTGSAAPVRAGDKIVLKETASSTATSLVFVDKTHPKANAKLSGAGDSGFSPQIGDIKAHHKSGAPFAIPNFGHVAFSKSMLDHVPFGTASPLFSYDMTNAKGTVQITTGPFASDNESFKTVFKHH